MNLLFINQFIDHPISSIISILVFVLIFSRVFWHLRRDWELYIKDINGWHLQGIYDSPTGCYDAIENMRHIKDYRIKPILKKKIVKQLPESESELLKQDIRMQELLENNRQIAESQERTFINLQIR